MKMVTRAITRTKETTVMVPMKTSSCLIWSSEMALFSSGVSLLACASSALCRGPSSILTGNTGAVDKFSACLYPAIAVLGTAAGSLLTCCARLGGSGPRHRTARVLTTLTVGAVGEGGVAGPGWLSCKGGESAGGVWPGDQCRCEHLYLYTGWEERPG